MEFSRPRRWIPPNSLWEITARTIQGRLLLRPSPEVNELILGVMGRALTLFAVTLHDFIWLSNHWHLIATFADGQAMRGFMNHVQSNVAREIGAEHDWDEKYWGRRYRAIPILDVGAQEARVRYIYENGVKEFLVERPEDWPGVSSLAAHLHGATLSGKWIDRTALFHARRKKDASQTRESAFTERYPVPVEPVPFLQGLSANALAEYYARLAREIEAKGAAKATSEKRSFLGVAKILAEDPHRKPNNVSHAPAPLCHAKTKAIRAAYHRCYRGFVDAFLNVAKRFRNGELTALAAFPAWCFPPPLVFRETGDALELDNLPLPDPAPA